MQEWINSLFEVLVGEIAKVLFFEIYGFPLIVLTLLFGALFFSFYFKFINIRGFKHSIEVIKGKYDNPKDVGQISHFQALTSALSGTIGLGNIAGVAIAVTLGGAGAVFWMMFIAIFSMSAKFVSGTLSQIYRKVNSDGSIDGGPMYYLDMGLKEQGKPKLGRFLGIMYAIFIIGGAFGGGNMFQANQSYALVSNQLPFLEDNNLAWLYGVILAALVGTVIIGGIKRIGKATEKIVPLMVVIYVAASLFIILTNIEKLPGVVKLIFTEAFSSNAIYGGIVGSIVMGIKRAVFSNEGGVGSASIAHSAAKTDEPVREGIVAMIGPFIDTILVCFMTASVILITRDDNKSYQIYQKDLEYKLIDSQISELNKKQLDLSLEKPQRKYIAERVGRLDKKLSKLKIDLESLDFYIEESYMDVNMNERWDDAEPFVDSNENDVFDGACYTSPSMKSGTIKPDWNKDTCERMEAFWKLETYTDISGNDLWDDAEPFVDSRIDNGNGKYDKGEEFDDYNGNGVRDESITYIIKSGDLLSKIAKKFNTTEKIISSSNNNISTPDLIIGDSLVILSGEAFKDTNKKWDPETKKAEGAVLTSQAFGSVISWFPVILTIVVFLFSYSTMISWYYYGDKGWTYLFGKKNIRVFQFMYLGFVVLGSIASLKSVVDFSDMMILSAAFPNIIGVMFLLPKIKEALNSYWSKYQKGEFKTYDTNFIKNLFSFKK